MDCEQPVTIEPLDPAVVMADLPPALAALLPRFARLFRLRSATAPGLACAGGSIPLAADDAAALGAAAISATGNGENLQTALISCLGEAADLLSPFERAGDTSPMPAASPVVGGWLGLLPDETAVPEAWILAQDIMSGRAVALPADVCLRRVPSLRRRTIPWPLSSGVSAGPSADAALQRAMLELIERDAAALWWLGGRPARRIAPTEPAASLTETLLARLRAGLSDRVTQVFDITADTCVPVAAAVSALADGRGLAVGFAARQTLADAACAALLEMAQMEMAAAVASMKEKVSGAAALNEIDRRHLRRAVADSRRIATLEADDGHPIPTALWDNAQALAGLLAAKGIRMFSLDLKRENIGVPVFRAVSPELQPFTDGVSTQRLEQQRTEVPGFAVSNIWPI